MNAFSIIGLVVQQSLHAAVISRCFCKPIED